MALLYVVLSTELCLSEALTLHYVLSLRRYILGRQKASLKAVILM